MAKKKVVKKEPVKKAPVKKGSSLEERLKVLEDYLRLQVDIKNKGGDPFAYFPEI